MKILIDSRFYGPEGTGIGRYLENLLNNLEQIDHENEYVVLLKKSNFHLFNPISKNFRKVLADAHWYGLKEQILITRILYKEKPDLVHFPHINTPILWKGKSVLTVHDLTPSEFAERDSSLQSGPKYLLKNYIYKIVLRNSIKRAKKIFVPSDYVKEKVAKKFAINIEKLKVTYEAVDKVFLENGQKKSSEGEINKVLNTYGIKEPFVLYVGNLFPYKNIKLIFSALKKIPANYNLVLVGGRNRFTDRTRQVAKELGIENRVNFTGFVPNLELVTLFQKAECFIFPSLSEGFGLPGLEAMACGCPVLAADASSLPEVYGEAALYFDPASEGDLVKKLNSLLTDKSIGKELERKGYERVKKFSWEKMAEETLAEYTKIA